MCSLATASSNAQWHGVNAAQSLWSGDVWCLVTQSAEARAQLEAELAAERQQRAASGPTSRADAAAAAQAQAQLSPRVPSPQEGISRWGSLQRHHHYNLATDDIILQPAVYMMPEVPANWLCLCYTRDPCIYLALTEGREEASTGPKLIMPADMLRRPVAGQKRRLDADALQPAAHTSGATAPSGPAPVREVPQPPPADFGRSALPPASAR